MDYKTEAKITDSISELNKYDIRLSMAHGLEMLEKTDYILFLKDGKVEERGAFSKLMKNTNFAEQILGGVKNESRN